MLTLSCLSIFAFFLVAESSTSPTTTTAQWHSFALTSPQSTRSSSIGFPPSPFEPVIRNGFFAEYKRDETRCPDARDEWEQSGGRGLDGDDGGKSERGNDRGSNGVEIGFRQSALRLGSLSSRGIPFRRWITDIVFSSIFPFLSTERMSN